MANLVCAATERGCLVRVLGAGTMRESPAFRAFVQRCLGGRPPQHVVVDLSECDFLDSTFLGCLIGLHKMGGEVGDSRLKFYAADNRCKRLFSSSMLDRYLSIVDECPQPTGDFEEIPSCELDAQEFGQHIMQCHRRLAAAGGKDSAAYESVAEQLSKELNN